jgi:GTP cyclohydrolase I
MPPDRAAMEKAVASFLIAAGLELDDPNLTQTPRRVTEAWAGEFLDGYEASARDALGEQYPVSKKSDRELVVVTQLRFRSMCPHHMLPYSGRAHLAYVPGKRVVGFGRLAKLVDVFAHRLILQEELARQVARALMKELKSQGAACVLEAQQSCLRLRGGEQHDAVTHAEAYEGVLREAALRAELWARITAKGPLVSPPQRVPDSLSRAEPRGSPARPTHGLSLGDKSRPRGRLGASASVPGSSRSRGKARR